MPTHERFYLGTEWTLTGGPEEHMGQRVVITGEVYPMEFKNELKVECQVVDGTGLVFEEIIDCELSWLS